LNKLRRGLVFFLEQKLTMKSNRISLRVSHWTRVSASCFRRIFAGAGLIILACFSLASAAPPDVDKPTPVLSSTVEIRETPKNYDVVVILPSADAPQVGVRMEGKTLRIGSGQSSQGARYEQSFLLPEAAGGSALTMKRENDRLTITIPKGVSAVAGAVPQLPPSNPPDAQGMSAWSGSVLSQFARMEQQMDAMMNQAMQNFGEPDPFARLVGGGFMDALSGGGLFNLEDKPDKYIITAGLSEEDAKNVKVTVENDRILRMTTRNESTNDSNGSRQVHAASATQVLTLPGPVKADKMTMDYKDGGLKIVLPKAA
jgi:HSP20 family molecular chaperone IbpA